MPSPIRVMVVDDSAVARQVIGDIINKAPGFTLLATAPDPIYALEKMQREWPDVLVLDVEMPRMDGITFLRKIMNERPTPVVICSTLTEKGAETTMQAMAAGAVEIIVKPKAALKQFLEESAQALLQAVRAASQARVSKIKHVSDLQPTPPAAPRAAPVAETAARTHAPVSAVVSATAPQAAMAQTTERVVAIGTSTGGTQALETVLTALPRVCPGIVVVQHMPEKFTASFAQRLNQICAMEVREAQHNDRVLPGLVLIAPGGRHMMMKRSGAYYHVDVVDGPLVSRHKPSVDVLFRSVAKAAGRNALGVIMTGMGDDGASGLREMLDAGARTVAQDEATCVVYGMPKEAVKRGAVEKTVPLTAIAAEILRER